MIRVSNAYFNLADLAAVVPMGEDTVNIMLRSGAQVSMGHLKPEEVTELRGILDTMVEGQAASMKAEVQEIETRKLRAEFAREEVKLDREELQERRERRVKKLADKAERGEGESTPGA